MLKNTPAQCLEKKKVNLTHNWDRTDMIGRLFCVRKVKVW